uniref:Uncharacterized protein n=1 Tax=Arundo donax TaxID=35708 RepID=A0A0A8ZDJ9_ARUDO
MGQLKGQLVVAVIWNTTIAPYVLFQHCLQAGQLISFPNKNF